MFNSMFKKTGTTLVALLTAFAITTASTPAHADGVVQGNVSAIEVNLIGSNAILRVNVGTSQYISDVNSPCVATTLDNIKLYQSIVQAALLSGKKVNVSFVTCGGGGANKYINFIDLF